VAVAIKHASRHVPIAAVLDGDNIFRDDDQRRITPDVVDLASALQERGVRSTTVCQNFFTRPQRNSWKRFPYFYTFSTGENCDRMLMLVAIEYVMSGLDWLIIGSGDADYLPLVEAARHAGTRVEVWAKHSNASKRLVYEADSVVWIDDLIVARPPVRSDLGSMLPSYQNLQPGNSPSAHAIGS
jgi:hypothetical protein